MAACDEALLTSEVSGQLWNICAWDPSNGVSLATYKGLSSGPRTLDVIQNHFVISAANAKSLIHVWPLHKRSQEDSEMRIVCSGHVQALAISPDGGYCVAAIAEKIHVWQMASGQLLCVLSQHYQPVNTIRFTDDGSHFVSAGEDSVAIVWSMYRVLNGEEKKPRQRWSEHSLPITDVHIGRGGARARVITGSLDNTARVYELHSGRCLCCITLDSAVTAITMDATSRPFIGLANGNIAHYNFYEPPTQSKVDLSEHTEKRMLFEGHTDKITCLCVNVDSTQLVSGSHDMLVKIWDIPGRACLRTIPHKGSVSNVRFCGWDAGAGAGSAGSGSRRWAPAIAKFQSTESTSPAPITVWHRPTLHSHAHGDWHTQHATSIKEEESGPSRKDLIAQNEKLKAANKELYRLLKEKIATGATDAAR